MSRKKILFLGETFRADAITWMNGVREYGDFDLVTWELKSSGRSWKKLLRAFELLWRLWELRNFIKKERPVLILAERITSYGFIGSLFHRYAPVIAAQQGVTDIFPPDSPTVPLKKKMQAYVFRKATLIHAWGNIMTYSMVKGGCTPRKIMVLAKGIDLRKFRFQQKFEIHEHLKAIVTRSLTPDYRHETILRAFVELKKLGVPFQLTIIGDGNLKTKLEKFAEDNGIGKDVLFTGRINNNELPEYLSQHDLYLSMPCTEGVSSSLFEAMAVGCYPMVSKLPGTEAWITDFANGRLVEVDHVAQLADALQWYAMERPNLDSVRLENRDIVEQLADYEKNMKSIAAKYHSLCAE